MTKCDHTECNREVTEINSVYCNRCIQLNTRKCNYCQVGKIPMKRNNKDMEVGQMTEKKKNEIIIKCPKCNITMNKLTNGHYIIDKCSKCKGVFLDGDEINNIKKISFFKYVSDYFRRDKNE